jgi:hypothetical protein
MSEARPKGRGERYGACADAEEPGDLPDMEREDIK